MSVSRRKGNRSAQKDAERTEEKPVKEALARDLYKLINK
jgi:hypothetical protein